MPMSVELILIFLVFLAAVYWWMNRKPAVEYRPTREDVLVLLRKVFGGMATELEWETFTGVPIQHDSTLEEIRKRCVAIDNNPQNHKDHGTNFILNDSGLATLRKIISDLEGYCRAKGREKTEFQINCAEIVQHKMEQLHLQFAAWKFVDEPEESYFLGELKGLKVYIYEDGAGIKAPQGSYMYANEEYKSEAELTRALVDKVVELATMGGAR